MTMEVDFIHEKTNILIAENPVTLSDYANLYFHTIVSGSPLSTEIAKKNDLSKFIYFFTSIIKNSNVDGWTPSVSRHFQKLLKDKKYKGTTINRIFASLRHFAKWLNKTRPLLAGDPLKGIKDIVEDNPDWNGLTSLQIMRLKSACEQRMATCIRADQNPLLELTIFYILLNTGLRVKELVSLNIGDYYTRGFHDVGRKGNKISSKVSLPVEAKEYLDKYLDSRLTHGEIFEDNTPLLLSRPKQRITTRAVAMICEKLAQQASALLPDEEKFHLSPHMLRHTFLKKIADKHGIHTAQELSGNISIKEIFRYTKPSQSEIDNLIEELDI